MDRETDIFDQDVQEASSGDLDVDLANAGHVLQKIAEETGVDLNLLPDAEVAQLVRDLLPAGGDSQTTQETRKEASAMSTETQTETETQIPNEPTYADVAVELAKVAAEQGINLNEISREDYHEAFSKLAEAMADPTWSEKQAAAEAEAEKSAAAYEQGRNMADGFLARLKEAEDEDEKEKKEKEKKDEEEKKEAAGAAAAFLHGAKDKAKKMLGKGVGHAVRAGEAAKSHASHAAGAVRSGASHAAKREGEIAGAAGKMAPKRLTHAVAGHMSGPAHERLDRARKAVGRAAIGAGAAGAAAGAAGTYAAGHAHGRSKESLDEAALLVAQDLAVEMGYDPSTGEKIAEETPELDQDQIAARAIEMLKEAGYPVE